VARPAFLLAGALALAAASSPAAAAPGAEEQGPPTPDRVQEQEKRLQDQERRIQELERRLAEAEGRAGVAPSAESLDAAVRRYLEARPEPIQEGGGLYGVGPVQRPANLRFRFGGYISTLFRMPDRHDPDTTFEGLRMVPQFAFDVSDGIEFATEIEFERGGADASFLDDNEVLVEYAEVRFDVHESFVPKMGILLVPFLRYNLYHDDPIWNLQDRPFTATRIFKAAFQQPGVGAEGVFPLGGGNSLNYNLALTNGPDDGVTNSRWSGARQDFKQDNNDDKTIWARVGAAPRLDWCAADLGFSWATGRMDAAGEVRMTAYGFDGKLTRDRFDVIFEWTRFHYDRPASQDFRVQPTGTHGGFVEVDFTFLRGLPRSESGIVGDRSTLALATRYEWSDTNTRVTGAALEDDARAVVAGLAFRPTPKTVVRLERRWERSSFDDPDARRLGGWLFSLSTYF